LKYYTRFCKQWRNKGGKWGHTVVLSADLEGASTYVAII